MKVKYGTGIIIRLYTPLSEKTKKVDQGVISRQGGQMTCDVITSCPGVMSGGKSNLKNVNRK